ncbi:Double zinc ribbon [Ruminococcaceae bacterium YRB3002]|nr:Double zinc ribbon [Ruminococcaceae bacterium YRB3002]
MKGRVSDMKRKKIFNGDMCAKCHAHLGEDDKFCRYCGSPRKPVAFVPANNRVECVYGPPFVTTHTCTGCGYSWTVDSLGIDRAGYCPKCGSEVRTESECKLK